MAIKNINTDILFFQEINKSKRYDSLCLCGVNKDTPVIRAVKNDNSTVKIPIVNLLLSINAIGNLHQTDADSFNFDKIYKICIRITEPVSNRCIDTIEVDVCPCNEQIDIGRKLYNKKYLFSLRDIVLPMPSEYNSMMVLKVLIQDITNGEVSETEWIAQSIHPVKITYM